jgi:uncharacterized protein
MIVDAHTHIFPPEIAANRERFFAGEPEFKLLYDSQKAKLATAEALLSAMDADGIGCAVTFGFPWRSGELAARHNDYVLAAATRYPSRLIPMGCFSITGPDCIKEAERCFRAGAKGLGELAMYGGEDLDRAAGNFKELAALCRSHNGVLLVHSNEPVGHVYPGKARVPLDFFYALAREAVSVPLVFAHWGGGLCFYELLKKEAPEVLAQVYYDTAASPFLYRPEIYRLIAGAAGRHKILFGSDYPLLPLKRCLDDLAAANLPAAEYRAIAGENAARLFRIGESM